MILSDLNTTMKEIFHRAGARGSGLVFAVLDTGVKPIGPLVGKVTGSTKDTDGHGTFVAGQLIEWCPDATIHSYRVLPDGTGRTEDIIWALHEVLLLQRIDRSKRYIVNMSLSGNYSPRAAIVDEYRQALEALAEIGVPVFVAAGNDGKEAISKYPSCFESPITVSAVDNAAKQADFSTFHNEVDFAEWGVDVPGLSINVGTSRKSGTSFACPNVAGKAGLLLSAYHNSTGQQLPEPELYEMLKHSALDLGIAGKDKFYGWGWLDIRKAEITMKKLDQFIAYLEEQVRNHSIYVWGAQGETAPKITAEWIRSKEKSSAYAKKACTYWLAQVVAGYGDVLRAFDCSGLGMYWMQNVMGLYTKDMSANSMMGKCTKIERAQLQRGDWVFRVYASDKRDSSGKLTAKKGDAYHIGYVVDDALNVIEAKGREDGVVKRKLSASGSSYWNAYGRPEIFVQEVGGSSTVLRITSPLMRSSDIQSLQIALNGMGYPCGTADGICGNNTLDGVRAFCKAHEGV
ncbi:S8 family serine peptidase [Eubacteriales bacterium OttesenSCG-928-K08]|nr:S8 family serine peptidase [Eubacteriales bacterium OttesenSCG-928-K08]